MSFWIKLTPPKGGELGDIDEAVAIGDRLIQEYVMQLINAALDAGFEVDGTVTEPLVY